MGLLVLLGALAAAAAFARAQLQNSDVLRDSVERVFRDELGLSLETAGVGVGFLPPRVSLSEPVLRLADRTVLLFEGLEVDLAFAPLLAAHAQARRIRARGRAKLAVATVSLEADIDLRLTKRDPAGWRADLLGKLATGGSFQANGNLDPAGWLEGAFEFQELEMKEVAVLLQTLRDPGGEFVGRFGGSVHGRMGLGTAGARSGSWRVQLQSRNARIRVQDITLEGPVRIQAELKGSWRESVGSFEIDAEGALLEYAGGMQKASGRSALVTGRIVTRAGRLAVDQLKLSLTSFRGELEAAPTWHRRSDER